MFAKLKLSGAVTTLVVIALLQGCGKTEQPAAPATVTAAEATAGKLVVESAIAKDSDTPPATSFSADIPKLYAFFKSTGTKQGDSVRGVWIAEDVGAAAPKETKIEEAAITADKADASGAFSLSKPNNGWPVGQYRVEIFVADKLASTSKFKIE